MLEEIRTRTLVEDFFNGGAPVIYSGTAQKFDRLSKHLQTFARRSGEKEWGRSLGFVVPKSIRPLQMAVPAYEPNELIEQHSLLTGKTINQMHSLGVYLSSGEVVEDGAIVKIPDIVYQLYVCGGVLPLLTTDVGIREKWGRSSGWVPRRNLYLGVKDAKSARATSSQVAKTLITYYSREYKNQVIAGSAVRAVDSAIALSTVRFNGNSDPELGLKIFPANSTAGLVMERHPLATTAGQQDFVDFLISTGSERQKLAALRMMDKKAGGATVEALALYCIDRNIHYEILADNGENGKDKEEVLIDHVKGAPYALLQALLLTLASTDVEMCGRRGGESFLVELFPKGKKRDLAI